MKKSTDITAIHINLKTALTTAFPDVAVSYYTRIFEQTESARNIFIHLSEITPTDAQTDGAESLEIIMRWEFFAVFRFRDPQAKGMLRAFVARLMAFVRAKRFNAAEDGPFYAGPMEIIGAYPDEMKPGDTDQADGYEVYRIVFNQAATILADDIPVTPVTTVFVGAAPRLGLDYETQYRTTFPQP